MKKSVCSLMMVMVLAALVLFTAGCPRDPNDPSEPQTGSIRIHGNLYGASGEKALSYPELITVGDAFKGRARWIQVSLCQQGNGMGKGGGGCISFDAQIIDGVFDRTYPEPPKPGMPPTEPGIWPGDYDVYVNISDADHATLFCGQTTASIIAGQTTNLEVEMNFLPTYYFRFGVNNLPGQYLANQYGWGDCESTRIVEADGTETSVCWWWENGELMFGVSLPLDFQGGTLVLTDSNGDTYQSTLPLVVADLDFAGSFRFNDVLRYDYVAVDIYGDLDLDITFGYEKPPVTANGQQYASIQDAIDSCEPPVNITLGEGDYDGFTIPYRPYPRTVVISGLGPDKSRIVDNDLSRPHVIYGAPWSYPASQAEATANLGKSVSVAKGGGGWAVQLYNLSVHNGPGKRDLYYSDAAVAIEGAQVDLWNVVIASESNTPLEVNYDSSLSVDHCIFVGPHYFTYPFAKPSQGVAAYNEQDVRVFNSIIIGCETPFYCSNGYYTTGYNCVHGYNALGTCERNPWTIDVTGFVFADPLMAEDWRLNAGSPCIGAANDGGDIGIDRRPTHG